MNCQQPKNGSKTWSLILMNPIITLTSLVIKNELRKRLMVVKQFLKVITI